MWSEWCPFVISFARSCPAAGEFDEDQSMTIDVRSEVMPLTDNASAA